MRTFLSNTSRRIGRVICFLRSRHNYAHVDHVVGEMSEDGWTPHYRNYQCQTCKGTMKLAYSQKGPGDVEVFAQGKGIISYRPEDARFGIQMMLP